MKCFLSGRLEPFFLASRLSAMLQLERVADPRVRGQVARNFQNQFTDRFAKSRAEANVLRGKRPDRILWGLFAMDNYNQIADWIEDFLKHNT